MSMSDLSKKITVSVVIATYNRSRMVREAVLAAWNQTLPPDEIVVSDDCSPDDTLEVLEALKKEVPILKIISTSTNSGGVPNWNHVIEASSGELIAWCSDDDRFKPDHLKNAIAYLSTHEEVGLIHSGFEEVFDGGETRLDVRKTQLKSNSIILVNRSNAIDYFSRNFSWYFHPSTLVFRRSLWNSVGHFDKRYALADTDWFLRAAINHQLVYLPYYGVINRRHAGGSGNWSARVGSIEMQRELYRAIENFIHVAHNTTSHVINLDKQFSQWLNQYRLLLLRIFISRSRAGRREVARDCANEILRVTPILSKFPSVILNNSIHSAYYFLSCLQLILPGGRNKYKDLGKYIPM